MLQTKRLLLHEGIFTSVVETRQKDMKDALSNAVILFVLWRLLKA